MTGRLDPASFILRNEVIALPVFRGQNAEVAVKRRPKDARPPALTILTLPESLRKSSRLANSAAFHFPALVFIS